MNIFMGFKENMFQHITMQEEHKLRANTYKIVLRRKARSLILKSKSPCFAKQPTTAWQRMSQRSFKKIN
jgi:hypothetical protein